MMHSLQAPTIRRVFLSKLKEWLPVQRCRTDRFSYTVLRQHSDAFASTPVGCACSIGLMSRSARKLIVHLLIGASRGTVGHTKPLHRATMGLGCLSGATKALLT